MYGLSAKASHHHGLTTQLKAQLKLQQKLEKHQHAYPSCVVCLQTSPKAQAREQHL